MVLGYVFSIVSSLFFTIYVLPRKMSKQKPIYYTMFVGLGYFSVSIITYIIIRITGMSKEQLFSPVLLIAILAGVFWMLGQVFFVTAIDKIGITRSNQWKNAEGPIGSILILIFFAEATNTNVPFLLIAITATLISAILFTVKKEEEKIIDKKGIIYAIGTASLCGINALLRKYITSEGFVYIQQIYSAFAVLTSTLLYVQIKDKNAKEILKIKDKNNYLGIISGSVYYFASHFYLMACKNIQGSIATTIVQLSTVWTLLVGIFFFKEINFKKNWIRISIGMALAITGVVLLVFAQK